jgi:hypothetical protein
MPAKSTPSPARRLPCRFGAETGSQTTEYALILVVTATKLRQYD